MLNRSKVVFTAARLIRIRLRPKYRRRLLYLDTNVSSRLFSCLFSLSRIHCCNFPFVLVFEMNYKAMNYKVRVFKFVLFLIVSRPPHPSSHAPLLLSPILCNQNSKRRTQLPVHDRVIDIFRRNITGTYPTTIVIGQDIHFINQVEVQKSGQLITRVRFVKSNSLNLFPPCIFISPFTVSNGCK